MQKKHPKINFRIHNSNGKKKRIFEIIGAPLKCEAGSGCESQKSKKMSCFDFAWGHFWTCSHWTPLCVQRWNQVKSFPFAILLLFVLLSVLLWCCPRKFGSQYPSLKASFWGAFAKEVWKAKARSQETSPILKPRNPSLEIQFRRWRAKRIARMVAWSHTWKILCSAGGWLGFSLSS